MCIKINTLNKSGVLFVASANKLTLFIVIFMLLGILSGAVIHAYASPGTITAWAENITLLPTCSCD
jgi:hypothetical protein